MYAYEGGDITTGNEDGTHGYWNTPRRRFHESEERLPFICLLMLLGVSCLCVSIRKGRGCQERGGKLVHQLAATVYIVLKDHCLPASPADKKLDKKDWIAQGALQIKPDVTPVATTYLFQ